MLPIYSLKDEQNKKMIINTKTQKKFVILLLALIIFLPWFNSNYFDAVNPVELGTEDTSFYEINPCKISLAEYLNIDIKSSFFIGDSVSDYEAAKKLNLKFYYKKDISLYKQIKHIISNN